MIKAAMILALFGGVRKYVDDSQRVPVRGDIHILICGDPGTGKSQLLQVHSSIHHSYAELCTLAFLCMIWKLTTVCPNGGDDRYRTTMFSCEQAVAQIAPKGLYISGNGSTTAGISASVVQDTLTGDYAVEAGALVLASGGICCIDELDKLKADHKVNLH